MSGQAQVDGYAAHPSMAVAMRDVDDAVSEAATVPALRRENERLRIEARSALRCAEAEREESSRLRNQNLDLATQLNQLAKSSITRDELMDAARAAHSHAWRVEPQYFEHWVQLADRFEAAAMEAQP